MASKRMTTRGRKFINDTNIVRASTNDSDAVQVLQQELAGLKDSIAAMQNNRIEPPTAVESNQHVESYHLKTADIRIPKYSGAHEPKTPYDFLQEIEKYRRAVGFNANDILHRVIPVALTDEANRWFLFQGHLINSWDEFKKKFRREF